MITWEVAPELTSEHTLDLKDPEGWYEAYVRFDGCITFTRHFNRPGGDGDSDQLHICSIDEEIARLQKIKEMAKTHFGEKWPKL